MKQWTGLLFCLLNLLFCHFLPSQEYVYISPFMLDGNEERFIARIDTETQKLVDPITYEGEFYPSSSWTIEMVTNPDGTKGFLIDGSRIIVSDLVKGVNFDSIKLTNKPDSLIFKSDGTLLYAVDKNKAEICIIDVQSHKVIEIVNFELPFYSLAITSDGSYAYILHHSKTNFETSSLGCGEISVLDMATHQVIKTITNEYWFPEWDQLILRPDDKYIYLLQELENQVSVIDTSTNDIFKIISIDSPSQITISSDSTRAYLLHDAEEDADEYVISVIDLISHDIIKTLTLEDRSALDLKLSPDGLKAYVIDFFVRSLLIIDLETCQTVTEIDLRRGFFSMVFTEDGKFVYISNINDKSISIINLETKKIVKKFSMSYTPGELLIKAS